MTRKIPENAPKKKELVQALERNEVAPLLALVDALELLDKGIPLPAPDGNERSTRRVYKTGAENLLAFTSAHGLTLPDLTMDMALVWLRGLEASGKAPATVTVYLAGARRLLKALRQVGLLHHDPLEGLTPRKESRPPWERREAYTVAEAEALVTALEERGEWPLLTAALLAYDAGLRASEIASLTFNDINEDTCTIRVGHAKRGKWREVAITPRLARVLRHYRAGASSLRVWPYTATWCRNKLQNFCTANGLEYKALHALRHTHATRLANAGLPLTALASQLGHARLQSSEPYLEAPDLETVRSALRGNENN